jgi:hypothetical protein
MKNKTKVPEKPVIAQDVPAPSPPQLPDPPYIPEDLPAGTLPKITQAEIGAYVNARSCFLTTRADFEKKRADLTLKLLQLCLPEPGTYIARLENDGEKLVVLEHCQCCHSSGSNHDQCEACHTWQE